MVQIAWALLLLLLAAGASAEGPPEPTFSGSLEAGAYWSSDDEYEFGDFTGLGEDEWNVLGNFKLTARPPWDSGKTWNFRARGDNLGLDSRHIDARGGLQGLFDLRLSWDQIPHLIFDDGEMPFRGRGTDLLTLPPDWVPGTTTRGFGALPATLENLRIERDRRTLRAGNEAVLPHGFELSTRYRHDRQVGRKPIGSVIGNTGGNPRSVIIPEPIDWRTQDGDVALRWAGESAQAQVGYEISHFENGEDSLTWQNPYSAIGGWNPAAGYPTGFGSRGMLPDNEFHQVKASGGYSLPFDTRIMAHAAFGWMFQDDDFQPYTVNPAILAPRGLPGNDANAEIQTTVAGVRVTSEPIDRLNVTAEWRLDDRDNDTPRDTYVYVAGDSLNQPDIASDRARVNLPQSYRSNLGRIEVGYEVFERSELTFGYQYEQIDRSWTEADEVKEDSYRVRFRSRPIKLVDFRVDATWAERDGGDYYWQAPLAWGFSPEHVEEEVDLATDFENHPLLRKYTLADRQRTTVDSHLTVTPLENLVLGANLGFARDDYDDSELGLQERTALSWGFDVSWTPLEQLTAYAYYANESLDSRQNGRSFGGTPQPWDPRNDWRQRDDDEVDTVGVGLAWEAIADRLTVRSDFVYSRVEEAIHVGGPVLANPQSFPNNDSKLFDASVQVELRVVEHVNARVGYLFEHCDVEDWAYQDVWPSTIGEVLTLGNDNPDYDAHLVGFSVEYEF